MSSRLVILRHKSWNVWNQDNREKVLRDERLHREAEEAKLENERKLQHERNLAALNQQGNNDTFTSEDMQKEVAPFRLFEDLEKRENEQLMKIQNPDYLKEQAEKERKKRKREGIEDWKLGDGSYESNGLVPWYQRPATKHPVEAKQKDDLRKQQDDPMNKYIRQYIPIEGYLNESKVDEEGSLTPPLLLTNQPNDSNSSVTSNSKDKKKKDKNKKSDKHKKQKHKHNHKHKHEKEEKQNILEELRKKRLEREKLEHKRETLLKAHVDVYGHSGSSASSTPYLEIHDKKYHQQFNPQISRKFN